MNKQSPPNNSVEEISAEEVEVVEENSAEKIRKISADEPYNTGKSENPMEKFLEQIQEAKKIKPFGIMALLLSLIGLVVYPLYLSTLAVILAIFDIWRGSKFTRKISYVAIFLALLSLLNTWN